MKNTKAIISLCPLILIILCMSLSCSEKKKMAPESQDNGIDMVQARKEIENNVKQFSEDFKNADSLALAGHYASDGTFGSIKKDDLDSAWGSMIRNAVKRGTPEVRFTTNSLFSDGEYLVEIGLYEFLDKDKQVKSEGKYLVVWKQEDGSWKMYRDIGL